MAKYDQGGGHAIPARIKITDAMVEAAVTSFHEAASADGFPPPPEDEAPEQWAAMRKHTRNALKAARDAI